LNRVPSGLQRRFPGLSRRVIEPGLEIADRVQADQLGVEAGSLTYGAFLAIPPALLLAVSISSLVLANDVEAQQKIVDHVASLIPGLEQVVTDQFNIKSAGQLGMGIVGIVLVLWAASGFAARARNALGAIFSTTRTGLVTGRLSATLVGVPAFIGFVALGAAAGFAGNLQIPWWADLLVVLAFIALAAGYFLLIYWALTPGPAKPTLRDHIPGALSFAVAAAFLERIGGRYVAYVIAHTTALYGTIGTIFGLLAFLYMTMWVFLLGAEITRFARFPLGRKESQLLT
jgi:YihY family inner membrane protein